MLKNNNNNKKNLCTKIYNISIYNNPKLETQ